MLTNLKNTDDANVASGSSFARKKTGSTNATVINTPDIASTILNSHENFSTLPTLPMNIAEGKPYIEQSWMQHCNHSISLHFYLKSMDYLKSNTISPEL